MTPAPQGLRLVEAVFTVCCFHCDRPIPVLTLAQNRPKQRGLLPTDNGQEVNVRGSKTTMMGI